VFVLAVFCLFAMGVSLRQRMRRLRRRRLPLCIPLCGSIVAVSYCADPAEDRHGLIVAVCFFADLRFASLALIFRSAFFDFVFLFPGFPDSEFSGNCPCLYCLRFPVVCGVFFSFAFRPLFFWLGGIIWMCSEYLC